MSTRALTPVSITRSSLIRSRLVTCSTVASGHAVVRGAGQVRMFCGRGWKYAWYNNHHNRVNRRDVLHDMAKLYRGQYTLVKRMANRRSGKQQFWKEWNNSLKQSHDERGDIWRDSKRQRDYWKDNMSELVKKIESDPYNFLFGKSNEYLQLGKGWSSFCRSFLDPKASPEQKSSTSSAQDRSAKSTTDDVSGKNSVLEKDSKVDTLKSNTCSEADGFRYDPISGRMKPIEKPAAQVARDEAKDDNQRIDIPVKVFTRSEGTNSDHIVPEQKSLGVSPPTQVNDSKILYTAAPTQDKPVTLENLSKVPTDTSQQSKITQTKQKKILQYNPKEVTEDDVDLLRASDIRAAFFTGETKQELAEKKKKLREAMEKDYTLATNEHVDDLILQSLRQKKDASLVKGTVTTTEILADPLQVHNVLQSEKSEVVDQGDDSNTITKGHVSDTTVATSRLNNSLDETIQRAGRFINDVRLLTGDIQKACERLEASASSPSNTLRILAFDSASSQVVCAETTSSMHASEPIHHTADVLLQLNNPAKFLPYFAKMKADGYEIVSGGSDILIFRKTVGSESVKPAKLNDFTVYGKREPENSTSMPDNDGESSLNKDPSKSKIVRRQETVYTGGPPNWSPYYPPSSSSPHASNAAEGTEAAQTEASTRSSSSSRLGRGLRRIVLSGVATAGTFYAIGVVCEYFLTGGQDGLGPEGFTEFEAERRRRE